MDPMLYHAHHAMRSEDLSFWRDLAAQSGGPVLELGCGTGRVLLRLLKDNLEMVGIDNDPEMLQFLQGLIPPKLAHLVEIHDVDMLKLNLNRQFPLIILPCNTLSTFPAMERVRIFRNVERHLTAGGLFVFSVPNPLLLRDLPATGDEELEDEFSHPVTHNTVRVFSSWEKTERRITFFWRYMHRVPEGGIVEEHHSTTHYLDPPQAYLQEMTQCGLKPATAFGGFLKEKFEPQSPYFILGAQPGALTQR